MPAFTNMLLYERIKGLCDKKGVSINKMLTECCINSSFMQDLKSKNVKPSVEKILKIAIYFNVSTDYLLGLTDDPAPVGTNKPLAIEQGDRIVRALLDGTGLIGEDGTITPDGLDIIAGFIRANADMLRKLLHE